MNHALSLRGLALAVLAAAAILTYEARSAIAGTGKAYFYITPTSVDIPVNSKVTISAIWCTPYLNPPKDEGGCSGVPVNWSTTGGHLSTTSGPSTTFSSAKPGHYVVSTAYGGKTYQCKIFVYLL
jgi:hypothetical protein